MKGTVGDLLLAEDLAKKGRFADAINVADQLLGIPKGANEQARLDSIKAALKSTESASDSIHAQIAATAAMDVVDGQSYIRSNIDPKKARLTNDLLSVAALLKERMNWSMNRLVIEQSQAALWAAVSAAEEIISVVRDESAAELITLDDQATLLAVAASFSLLVYKYDEDLNLLLRAAIRRAPSLLELRDLIRHSLSACQTRLKDNSADALAKRDLYQFGVDLLTSLADIVNTAAEVVDHRAGIRFSDVPSKSAPDPRSLLDAVINRMNEKMKQASEPEQAGKWAKSIAEAQSIYRMPDPPHLSTVRSEGA